MSLYKTEIDQALIKDLDARYNRNDISEPERILEEAVRHAVLSSGKRIRPMLALLGYTVTGGENREDILQWIIGLEYLHCYTLVHDDLPAMDNDTLRRWVPTVWAKYGEYTGVLVGDALQSMAFESLAKLGNTDIILLVAQMIGDLGVVRGQMKDMNPELYPDESSILRLHYEKTALFLGTAIEVGGILAGAPEETCEQLKKYGTSLGLLFQITDDILDIEGNSAEIGKSVGKDTSAGKWLYGAVGHDRIHILKDEYLAKTLEIAHILDSDELKHLANKIATRTK